MIFLPQIKSYRQLTVDKGRESKHKCPGNPEECVGSFGAAVTSACVSPDAGSRTLPRALCKSNISVSAQSSLQPPQVWTLESKNAFLL